MSRLYLLFSTLVLSVVHLMFPYTPADRYKEYVHNGEIITIDTWKLPEDSNLFDFFLLSEMKTTLEWYVFYFCEHVILIVFALFIYMESDKYKTALCVFLLIQVADLIDFCLTYGFVWFRIGEYPIGFNLIKVVIFMGAIGYELSRNAESADG